LIDEFYNPRSFSGLGIGAATLQFVEAQCRQCESAPSASRSIVLTLVLVDYTKGFGFADTIADLMTKWLELRFTRDGRSRGFSL